jgi:hypothetical protein
MEVEKKRKNPRKKSPNPLDNTALYVLRYIQNEGIPKTCKKGERQMQEQIQTEKLSKKLSKKEMALLDSEISLASEKLKEAWSNYQKDYRNTRKLAELAMWYGRYVALSRLFDTSNIPDSMLSHIHVIVVNAR